jgi:hypothetical protein
MAIDTRSKRASILGLISGTALTLPLSDGVISQGDRQHVALTYAGLTAGVPPVVVAGGPDVIHLGTKESLGVTSHPTIGGWQAW